MHTINDLQLVELMLQAKECLHAAGKALLHGREHEAFKQLMEVEDAARRAQSRLNQMKYTEVLK